MPHKEINRIIFKNFFLNSNPDSLIDFHTDLLSTIAIIGAVINTASTIIPGMMNKANPQIARILIRQAKTKMGNPFTMKV
jgi:hypothetical protein